MGQEERSVKEEKVERREGFEEKGKRPILVPKYSGLGGKVPWVVVLRENLAL